MERGGRVLRDLRDESWELPGCAADGGVEEVETRSADFYWQGTRYAPHRLPFSDIYIPTPRREKFIGIQPPQIYKLPPAPPIQKHALQRLYQRLPP